jgi:prepilin-type N-terminal cleavage/methylation domain-containing protein
MNKKNGFTLVELMVVIVIIGVLAAVAIPKMMAATNKAKASEGPQILGTVANMQHAYKAEMDTFMPCPVNAATTAAPSVDGDGWKEIGFDQKAFSKYYVFDVVNANTNFTGTANLRVSLGKATSGGSLTIDAFDDRKVAGTASAELQLLVPNWK